MNEVLSITASITVAIFALASLLPGLFLHAFSDRSKLTSAEKHSPWLWNNNSIYKDYRKEKNQVGIDGKKTNIMEKLPDK